MRKFNPVHLAAAVVIALSGTTALAQTTGGTVRVAPVGTATTSGTTTTTTTTPGVSGDSGAASQSPLLGPNQSAGGSGIGTNQTTVDPATTRPGSFEPGGAFGPPGSSPQGTPMVPGTGTIILPGDAVLAGNPSQQTLVIQSQPAPEARTLSTPLLDQATREAQARETRRRYAKDEPRIIGIAPNTDRDLTDQMPDDRIIRY